MALIVLNGALNNFHYVNSPSFQVRKRLRKGVALKEQASSEGKKASDDADYEKNKDRTQDHGAKRQKHSVQKFFAMEAE